jgi:hypothetical protein
MIYTVWSRERRTSCLNPTWAGYVLKIKNWAGSAVNESVSIGLGIVHFLCCRLSRQSHIDRTGPRPDFIYTKNSLCSFFIIVIFYLYLITHLI